MVIKKKMFDLQFGVQRGGFTVTYVPKHNGFMRSL